MTPCPSSYRERGRRDDPMAPLVNQAQLDLIRRATIGACAADMDEGWERSEPGQLADKLTRGRFYVGIDRPLHIWRNAAEVADRTDEYVTADRVAQIQDVDLACPDVCARLKTLARHIEGAAEPGEAFGEQVFYLPGWKLIDQIDLGEDKPGTSLTTMQGFVVDSIGVRWLGRFRQGQNFGGKYLLELTESVGSSEKRAALRALMRPDGEPDTWSRIEVRATDHWNGLVAAVTGTRVYAAMQKIGRNDLRVALWLSAREHNGEARRLQLVESRPELGNQMLPLPNDLRGWSDKKFRAAWKSVSNSRKPKDVARWTWFGDDFAYHAAQPSSIDERMLAQDVASGRKSVSDLRTESPTNLSGVSECQREFCKAWSAMSGKELRELTWKRPQVVVSVISAGTRVLAAMRKPRWIPASLIVRAMLKSGLDAVERVNERPALAHEWAHAIDDLFKRSIKPQLAIARLNTGFEPYGWESEARLAKSLLQLLYGSIEEHKSVAKDFPITAHGVEKPAPVTKQDVRKAAKQRARQEQEAPETEKPKRPEPRWTDLAEWSRLWHRPAHLALARTIATASDPRSLDENRLATPLVLGAGGRLWANVRLIRTVTELYALGADEEHCIPHFVDELREGENHCLVIEDDDDKRRRSTALISERTRRTADRKGYVLEGREPYELLEILMRRNAPSPTEHRKRAEAVVSEWNRIAATREIRASEEERRHRTAARGRRKDQPIPLDRVERYWNEVSKPCIPAWLHDFDPAKGLIVRLYREQYAD